MASLELRKRTYPEPVIYAFYGIGDDGKEFGYTVNSLDAAADVIISLYNTYKEYKNEK